MLGTILNSFQNNKFEVYKTICSSEVWQQRKESEITNNYCKNHKGRNCFKNIKIAIKNEKHNSEAWQQRKEPHKKSIITEKIGLKL